MKKYILFVITIFGFVNLYSQTKDPADDGRKIKIPVIFHVIYKNNAQNINSSLFKTELKDLNADFSATNDMSLLDPSFRALVGNPNIEFVFLESLNGVKIDGINRVPSKGLGDWEKLLVTPDVCINVFVADHGNSSDILSDRINLNYKDVGVHSMALTHETGHWLGLYHVFGKIGSSSWWNVTFGDKNDDIDDTPVQKGATAICYEIKEGCPCPPYKTTYDGHKTLYNNFMDYNPCRCMFTVGQVTQMRNNIIRKKAKLF